MTKEVIDTILSREVIGPIIVIAASILIYGFLKRIIKRMFRINLARIDINKNKTMAGLVCNIMKYLIIVIDILIILSLYGVDTNAIIASLGVVGVVIGLSVQDTLKDFISGIFILSEDQYKVGDTVTISNFKGEVVGLGLKTTRIKAYTGEIMIINNRNIIEVINHSKEDSLAIVDINVEYNVATDKIEAIITDLCIRLSEELPNLKGKVELIGITNLSENGVVFRVTALTNPMQQYEVERLIRREIKNEFSKNKITIPYRQMVIHNG